MFFFFCSGEIYNLIETSKPRIASWALILRSGVLRAVWSREGQQRGLRLAWVTVAGLTVFIRVHKSGYASAG